MSRVITGRIVQLAFGAVIGCVLGGILTGVEAYWIALAVGLPLLLTIGGILGSRGAKKAAATGQPVLRPGIISTIPGVRPTPLQQPVLNPVSSAQPSAGVVLNGQTVGATAATEPAPASAGPQRGSPLWRVLSILTIAVGAALVLAPSYQVLGWIASDVAAGRPFDGRDMRTGLHQQDAFDQIVGVMGGTEIVSVNFYDSYILVSAPSSPGAATVDRYVWRDGRASRDGPEYTQPTDLQQALFDTAGIDMDIVADLVRESIADADLEGLDGVYPSIRRWQDEEPRISVSLSGSYFDAYYEYSVTGELIQRTGSAFD